MKATWILKVAMAHQEEEKSRHKVEEEIKAMKDQRGHHGISTTTKV